MIRGPKIELVLQRYTLTADGGASSSKSWTAMRKIKGSLTFIKGVRRPRDDKESTHATHQFWCSYPKGLNITEKDELSRIGNTQRFRILYSDDILEQKRMLKIDLLRII